MELLDLFPYPKPNEISQISKKFGCSDVLVEKAMAGDLDAINDVARHILKDMKGRKETESYEPSSFEKGFLINCLYWFSQRPKHNGELSEDFFKVTLNIIYRGTPPCSHINSQHRRTFLCSFMALYKNSENKDVSIMMVARAYCFFLGSGKPDNKRTEIRNWVNSEDWQNLRKDYSCNINIAEKAFQNSFADQREHANRISAPDLPFEEVRWTGQLISFQGALATIKKINKDLEYTLPSLQN